MRIIIYKKHYIITNEDDTMIPEERSSYTLTEEETIIFATAKFKPFHSWLEENSPQPNPFKKLVENEKDKPSTL